MKSTTSLGLYVGLSMALPTLVRAEPSDAYIAPPVYPFDPTQEQLVSFVTQNPDSYDLRPLPAAGTYQERFRSPTYSVADLGTVVITFLHTVDRSIGRMKFNLTEHNVGRTDELELKVNKSDGTLLICHDYGLDGWRLAEYHSRDAIIGRVILDPHVTLNSPEGKQLAHGCDTLSSEVLTAFKERKYTVVSGGT